MPARALAFVLIAVCLFLPAQAQAEPSLAEQIAAYRAASEKRDWAAMIPPLVVLTAQSPMNGPYLYQLGRARMGEKDYSSALSDLHRALPLNGTDPAVIEYRIAQCEALLGRDDAAARWLIMSINHGLRNLEEARKDPVIAKLRTRPDIAKLMGIVDRKSLPRTEGWRLDIRFLLDRIDRQSLHPYRTTIGSRHLSGALYTRDEFVAATEKLIAQVPKLSDIEIELELMRLIASLGDGHSAMWGAQTRDFGLTLPLAFYLFDEGLYVTAADAKYKDVLGSKVVSIDGKPISDALRALDPYISRDNTMWLKTMGPHALRHTPFLKALGVVRDDTAVDVAFERRGGERSVVRVEANFSEPDIWNKLPKPDRWVGIADASKAEFQQRNQKPFWWEWHDDTKVLYVQYNRVLNSETQTLAAFAEELSRAVAERPVGKLVIDMRNNNGGDTFANESLRKAIARSKANAAGRLFVIIGRRTFSAAMSAVSYFARDTHAIFVGEPTGGRPNSIGEETGFSLPYSGIMVNLADRYWQSGWADDFTLWRAPDIATPVSAKDYIAGRDVAMEAILAQPTP